MRKRYIRAISMPEKITFHESNTYKKENQLGSARNKAREDLNKGVMGRASRIALLWCRVPGHLGTL